MFWKVIAFKNVASDDFARSMKGSFVVYFFDPDKTECSIMCIMPFEFSGIVLNPIIKALLSSSFSNFMTLALVLLCVKIL